MKIAVVIVFVVIFIFALALCKAAKRGDRYIDEEQEGT